MKIIHPASLGRVNCSHLSFLLSGFKLSSDLVMFCQFIQNWSWSDTWGEILFARIYNSNSWSSIWNSNLRWNLTSMFYLSFRPCCQTREIFAILNEIVHEFEWSKGQKVSQTNRFYLTSFNKLTKIFCPSINYVVSKLAIFDPLPPLSRLFTK